MKTRYTKEELEHAVKISFSYAETLRSLGLNHFGSAYKTIKKYITLYRLDTSHFVGRGHLKGKTHDWGKTIPLNDILVENSKYLNNSSLKKRLVKQGLLKYKCSSCGISEWNNKPISLQMDHINGVNDDNRINNLRLLCPNCHSQTPTFAGRNLKTHNKCADCNKNISKVSTRCKSCEGKHRNNTKIEWPDVKTLIELVENTSYSSVARNLGVSDNAIRKRIARHS